MEILLMELCDLLPNSGNLNLIVNFPLHENNDFSNHVQFYNCFQFSLIFNVRTGLWAIRYIYYIRDYLSRFKSVKFGYSGIDSMKRSMFSFKVTETNKQKNALP